jgi:phosphinothricin acetyltransferase
MRIRDAVVGDLPAITDLFNVLIPTTTVGYRDDVATAAEMASWFDDRRAAGHPVLVAVDDDLGGAVVGYVCWSTFRSWPGYRHTAELTIHVDGSCHGRGVGRALMEALLEEARRRDIHVLVAGIDSANVASIAFHERLGFTEVARMPEVGRKFDRWLDLVLMQRIVDDQ